MPRLRLLPPVTEAETPEEAVPILEYLMRRGGPVAIDTETTGLDVMRARVICWSMATEDRRFFFPYELLGFFDPLFQRKDQLWYLANAKFDRHMLANMGYHLTGTMYDIIDMDAMEDDTRDHGLKEQGSFHYEARWGEFKELFLDPHMVSAELGLDKSGYSAFRQFDVGQKLEFVYSQRRDIVASYASCDAYFTYMRATDLCRQLDAIELPVTEVGGRPIGMKTLFDYYKTIEVPLTPALWDMERTGFLVDRDWVRKIDGPLRDGIAAAEKKLFDIIGYRFNPSSNEEVAEIVYGKTGFGLKAVKYTDGGKGEPVPAVDEKTLKLLQLRAGANTPAANFIEAKLGHTHLSKLHGTYVKKLESRLGPDGRVHCRLNQSVARTSRLSSSNPNMQNIPARNDPYKIRGCFVADPGTDLIDLDYPQIEFRIAAVQADEDSMMDAIRKGWDIHSANAANMYKADPKVSYEAIMEAKRKKDEKDPSFGDEDKYLLKKRDGAKTTGLGALYGEGPTKMAQDLKISYDEAVALRETFFETYTKIRDQIAYFHDYAKENEFTHTMLGRMRRLYRINNEFNPGLVAAEKRQAYNTWIQGSGAEMMKLAILRIYYDPDFQSLGGKLILTVHDELIAKAPKNTSKEVCEIMKARMAEPYKWGPIDIDYPVSVEPDGAIGYRWTDVK